MLTVTSLTESDWVLCPNAGASLCYSVCFNQNVNFNMLPLAISHLAVVTLRIDLKKDGVGGEGVVQVDMWNSRNKIKV